MPFFFPYVLIGLQVLRKVDALRKKVVSVGKECASLCAKVVVLSPNDVSNCRFPFLLVTWLLEFEIAVTF